MMDNESDDTSTSLETGKYFLLVFFLSSLRILLDFFFQFTENFCDNPTRDILAVCIYISKFLKETSLNSFN